jgi:hypothetical protein
MGIVLGHYDGLAWFASSRVRFPLLPPTGLAVARLRSPRFGVIADALLDDARYEPWPLHRSTPMYALHGPTAARY